MKFLTITKSKPIKLVVDTALKAGTPISITGEVANDDTAIGLVANDTAAGTESIAIVTEGMVDVNEIAASYGEALTDDCIAALKGITFLYGGKAVVPGGGSSLPDYSEASNGDALVIEDGAPAWGSAGGGGGDVFLIGIDAQTQTLDKTWQEIYDAVASGKVAYMLNVIPNVAIMSFPVLYIESSSFAVASFSVSASGTAMVVFAAASADDYPVAQQG